MLMAIWVWHNWRNKYNIIFVFANTGAEHPETLNFIWLCEFIYEIEIIWVEALVDPIKGVGTLHKVVDYSTAARNSEPFIEVVKKYGLPNKSYRHCNRELKLAPIHSYAKSVFGEEPYFTCIGIRVDEIDRMDSKAESKRYLYPFIGNVPTTKDEVLSWWREQPYDLKIPEHYGNCLFCFKKSNRKLATISLEHPEYFNTARMLEDNYSSVGVLEGNPVRKMYRGHKDVDGIFAVAKEENFKIYVDGNFRYSEDSIDIDEPCTHDCEIQD